MVPMRRWLPLIVVVLMLVLATSAWACPFCKDSVPNSDAQQAGGVPSGFNNTIYIMLASLIGMVGFVSFTLFKGARTSVNGTAAPRGFPLE
jgi:hypothetical protein